MATLTINEDDCMGCETCCELAPGVFQFDADSGKAKVVNPDGGTEEEIQSAIDSCPAAAITKE